jgi:hypothetical protein
VTPTSSKSDKPLGLPLRAPGGAKRSRSGAVQRLWAEFTDPGPAGDGPVFLKSHADGLFPAVFGIPFMAVGVLVIVLFSHQVVAADKKTLLPFVFGGVFGLAGLFVTSLGIKTILDGAGPPPARGGAPWTSDNDWDSRGARPDGAQVGGVAALFGRLFFFVFVGLLNILWTVPIRGGGRFVVAILVGFFDLIALAAVVEMILRMVQTARVGSTKLVWRKMPFFTGERFEAVFQTSRTMHPNGPPTVTLRRIEQRNDVEERDGVAPGLHPYEAWSSTKALPEFAQGAMTSIPFAIDVPAGQPGTDLSTRECTYWLLAVSVPVAGPDVQAAFLVPIYDASLKR